MKKKFILILFYSFLYTQDDIKTVHVFVALCDNQNQGIYSSNPDIEDGENPATNQYWGAMYGIKSFFKNSPNWKLVFSEKKLTSKILERCIFKHSSTNTYIIADAYKGSNIEDSINDFFQAASGRDKQLITLESDKGTVKLGIGGDSQLITYIGHNGLMEFELDNYPDSLSDELRRSIVLACKSRDYFCDFLLKAGATPLLLTTNRMAPEAYTLKAAIEGWIINESDEEIRLRAVSGYSEYQGCSIASARRLFVTDCGD